MISDTHQKKTVSSFKNIDLLRIEFVSFYSTKGHFSYVLGDQISHNLQRTINDASFLYAFVNMIGGDFIIVDVNNKE